MGKPLNWMLSGAPAKKPTSRILRRRLAATTILAVVPFLGYGRQAYAACDYSASPLITCNGEVDGVLVSNVANADVQVDPPPAFEVTTFGVIIDGLGHIQFTDNNASTIVNKDGPGLSLTSYGDYFDGEVLTQGAVTIETDATITGNDGDGIFASNQGSGDITITADGVVTGLTDPEDPDPADGIYARNFGRDITITTGAQSDIFGTENGIDARNGAYWTDNEDARNLTITANGYVTGDLNDAIHARNYGVDLTITTGAQSVVRGGGHGIFADNEGSGNLSIEANGWVAGYASEGGDGINAFNSEDGGTLTITTGLGSTIRGANDGIDAYNAGRGGLVITAEGEVTGYDRSGIRARNVNGYDEDSETGERSALTITTGPDSDVFGGKNGIEASNFGNGFLNIIANGQVIGEEGDGIYALNVSGEFFDEETQSWYFGSGTDLTVTTGVGSVVSGGDDGIDARQYGTGAFRITVNGSATGHGEDGSGVNAYNNGGGFQTFDSGPQALVVDPSTFITVGAGGVAQGNYAGIRAGSGNFQKIFITNDGLVRNLSAESHDRAIVTWGGETNIDNNSDLIGTVTLDGYYDFDDTLNNRGFWNMAGGTSDFGTGSEDTVNNTGTLLGADDPANIEHSIIRRLEAFNNLGGLISLVDGQQGDTMTLLAECEDQECEFPTLLDYTGDNGQLQVDTVLGQTPSDPDDLLSDELRISGNTNGTTTVHVNVVAVNGANTEGIPVIRILDKGTSAEEHFDLDGPVNGGFFIWDMRYDAGNNWHELYTVTTNPDGTGDPVLGVGALEIPAGFGAGQDIWFQTVGTLLQRQADLRSVMQGVSVTPVADFSEPVEPTPVATISPGFWFKGFATYIDRDDEENGLELDRKQTIYGGMAGFDFGTEEVVGDALLFGIFGGYITSDLEFNATNTEWNYRGPTVGAYVTYLDQAFYADATVKVDFLDVDIDPEDLGGDDADTDAVNMGARIDTGYKFGQTAYIEPQATLAVVHTEMDDVDIFGGTVEFDDDTSVRGRLGLRFGVDHTHDDATVYTADVTASVWENFTGGDSDVTIVDTGVPDFGASDDALSTYGDLSLGIGVANPDGWSTFVRGNYLFADDYEAFAGNAGVRFVW